MVRSVEVALRRMKIRHVWTLTALAVRAAVARNGREIQIQGREVRIEVTSIFTRVAGIPPAEI